MQTRFRVRVRVTRQQGKRHGQDMVVRVQLGAHARCFQTVGNITWGEFLYEVFVSVNLGVPRGSYDRYPTKNRTAMYYI